MHYSHEDFQLKFAEHDCTLTRFHWVFLHFTPPRSAQSPDLSMGQEIELDLKERSSVGLSPNTVLPSQQYCLNVKKRHNKGKPTGKDEFLTPKDDFAEIKFARFCSASCKSIPSRPIGLEANVEIKRGSAYQSSDELKFIKKMGTVVERQKIEFSCSRDSSFSCSIVDSLCNSDDESPQERSSVVSQDSNVSSQSVSRSWACMEPYSPDGFIEFCINSVDRGKYSTAADGRDSLNSKVKSHKVTGSTTDGNQSVEKDTIPALQKSVSAKVEASPMLSPSESDCLSRASPKVQYNTPFRKRFNPFTKSKSLRSSISPRVEISEVQSTGTNITRNRTFQKSLLNDFANAAKHSDIISEFINRDIQQSGTACSPVHLHGNLKLETKNGLSFFEFKVKCPEEVFVAKTWRGYNAFNWVYTIHSIDNRKKSNATGMESHDCDKNLSMVAQILVSSDLCSELKDGVFNNSMMTEFVLYDLTHLRPLSRKDSNCGQDASEILKASRAGLGGETLNRDQETLAINKNLQHKLLSSKTGFDDTDSYPWLSTELHPIEIAAIVLQIPFHKRESLKYKRGDRISAKAFPNLGDLSMVEQSSSSLNDRRRQEQLKVVVPTGTHGLPNGERRVPSSLLDRWRHGGGCDCGGWDMACPLVLLGNPGIKFSDDHPPVGNNHPLELFVQGAKGSTPAFSMTVVEEGQYAIDFHAQLSTLQAFSICVAILHGTTTFHGAEEQQSQQLSQCNSLKMLIEEEVELLIESVTRQEKKTVSKTQKGIPRSYALNPPFSPIARV